MWWRPSDLGEGAYRIELRGEQWLPVEIPVHVIEGQLMLLGVRCTETGHRVLKANTGTAHVRCRGDHVQRLMIEAPPWPEPTRVQEFGATFLQGVPGLR